MRCLNPFHVKHKGHYISVRCNRCQGCRATYEINIREIMYSVHKSSVNAVFLTLTIDPENMNFAEVIDKETGELYHVPTISKKDLQDFNRRIKYQDNKNRENSSIDWPKCHYVQTGEYGEHTMRPHYHSIYWNLHPKTIESMQKLWPKGHVKVDKNVTKGAIQYVIQHQVKAKRYNQKFYENQQEPFMTKSINQADYLAEVAGKYIEDRHNKIGLNLPSHKEYPAQVKKKVREKRGLPKMTVHGLLKSERLQEIQDLEYLEKHGYTKLENEKRNHDSRERQNAWFEVANRKKRL